MEKKKNNSIDQDSGLDKSTEDGSSGHLVKANQLPSQEDLEKEISEYLAKKYGGKVRVVSQMVFPKQLRPAKTDDPSGCQAERGPQIRFDMLPEELEAYLDEYVVKQDRAKAILATKICTHFNKIAYLRKKNVDALPVGNIKNNIILIGPTGVGKTYLIKLIAARLGVPFVKGDATKFSETGYVGGDVEDLIRDLVEEANGDLEAAQYGIVYIDEIDKIASSHSMKGPDVSRAGVQRALLKPLEETEVDLKVPHDPISQIEAIERYRKTGKREKQSINTKHVLFIVSGAFSGLADIIKNRLTKQGIGFGADIDVKEDLEWLRHVKPQDLIEYGFETEFVGRLPVIALLEELNEEDLFEILRNPNSTVIVSKKHDFKAYGIDLKFEEDALRLLAHQAYQEKTGARALVSVVERALLPFEKKLPSTDISFLVVTRKMVEDPEGELEKLLKCPDDPHRIQTYEAIVSAETTELLRKMEQETAHLWDEACVSMTPKRLEMAASACLRDDVSPEEACERVLFLVERVKSYEVSFFNRCGVKIIFEDEAVDKLLDGCYDDPSNLYRHCERLINILEYGLTLVRDKTGQDTFTIPCKAVENPELFINRLIRNCYNSGT